MLKKRKTTEQLIEDFLIGGSVQELLDEIRIFESPQLNTPAIYFIDPKNKGVILKLSQKHKNRWTKQISEILYGKSISLADLITDLLNTAMGYKKFFRALLKQRGENVSTKDISFLIKKCFNISFENHLIKLIIDITGLSGWLYVQVVEHSKKCTHFFINSNDPDLAGKLQNEINNLYDKEGDSISALINFITKQGFQPLEGLHFEDFINVATTNQVTLIKHFNCALSLENKPSISPDDDQLTFNLDDVNISCTADQFQTILNFERSKQDSKFDWTDSFPDAFNL